MKRALAIFLVICVSSVVAGAQEKAFPRLTFGAEWGYVGVFHSGYHHNFFAPEGYRVNTDSHALTFCNNAEAYFHIGYNLNESWNISFYAGLAGVEKYDKVIPLSIRGTRYFGEDPDSDRWFTFLDLGSGVIIKQHPQEILVGKIGGGYRLSLSRHTKLDFLVNLRTTYTHPQIEYYGKEIPYDRINRNNAYVSAISFDIAITF